MNRLRWIVFAAFAFSCGSAMAENWSLIGVRKDGTEIFIDIDSIRSQPIGWTSWTFEKYKSVQKGPKGQNYLSLLEMHVAKCIDHELAIKSTILYEDKDREGKVVGNISKNDYVLDFRPVAPGSIGEVIFNLTCPENSK